MGLTIDDYNELNKNIPLVNYTMQQPLSASAAPSLFYDRPNYLAARFNMLLSWWTERRSAISSRLASMSWNQLMTLEVSQS